MSLILEALKKLEREKQTPDRGFLVVAHVPWSSGPAGRSIWLGASLALGLVGLVALLLLRGRDAPPTTARVPLVVAPTPVATPPSPSLPARSAEPGPAQPRLPSAPASTLPSLAVPPRTAPRPVTPSPKLASPPTPTPAPPAAGDVDLRLNAITRQDGLPVAVLNDRVVREGDVFDGIHVIRIGDAEVEVEVDGKRRVVRF